MLFWPVFAALKEPVMQSKKRVVLDFAQIENLQRKACPHVHVSYFIQKLVYSVSQMLQVMGWRYCMLRYCQSTLYARVTVGEYLVSRKLCASIWYSVAE